MCVCNVISLLKLCPEALRLHFSTLWIKNMAIRSYLMCPKHLRFCAEADRKLALQRILIHGYKEYVNVRQMLY